MARTVAEAAKILTEIYEESFGDDIFEKYRIQWQQLREICDVRRLNNSYLSEIVGELNERGFSLAPFDDCIMVVKESNCSEVRSIPGRLVEKYLHEDGSKKSAGEHEDVELEDE